MAAGGHTPVAGIDEAGRGAWAGPVSAAAVILPLDNPSALRSLRGVTDSKRLSPEARERLAPAIRAVAIASAVGWADALEVDSLGILAATRLAMRRAVDALVPTPLGLLIDAVTLPDVAIIQRAFFFADAISLSVAAASILAKTERDARMRAFDRDWPGYGFSTHKGYGTSAHASALARFGPCPLHRMTFRPVAHMASMQRERSQP